MRLKLRALALVLLPALAGAGFADSPNNGAPACLATGQQSGLRSVSDGAGGMLVAWLDARIGGTRLYAQRLDASGAARWLANGVAVSPAGLAAQTFDLAPDGAGGAIVCWEKSGNYDVYAQRIDAAGALQWTATGVLLHAAAYSRGNPAVRGDGAGGAFVTFDAYASLDNNVFVQHVNPAGVPQWTAGGVPLVTAANDQYDAQLVPDGAGGAIVAWTDHREHVILFGRIYAQRVSAAGAPQWTANGVALGVKLTDASESQLTADGAGGAISAWMDGSAVYVQRVSAAGATQWAAAGTGTGPGTQFSLGSDGSGGAVVGQSVGGSSYTVMATRLNGAGAIAWSLALASGTAALGGARVVADATGATFTWQSTMPGTGVDLRGQRLDVAGNPLWASDGVPVCAASGDQVGQTMIPSGGGAFVAWMDYRNGATADIFAQRLDVGGGPAMRDYDSPHLLGIRDVANDQGGTVRLTWDASPLDAPAVAQIGSYWIWRQAPATAARMPAGAVTYSASTDPPPQDAIMVTTLAGVAYYWEFVASQPAGHFSGYSYVAATTSDSVAASNPRTAFLVQARATDGVRWWDSNPDSGYSVDNLPPSAPMALAGSYLAGVTSLHWHPNPEADLSAYRLYRGSSSVFTPAAENFVVQVADSNYIDPGGPPAYYKLSAVDIHGNEGPYSTLAPGSTTDVPVDGLTALDLAISPNPLVAGTRVRFALPREAHVSLRIFDATGRMVGELLNGTMTAGEHAIRWDGHAAGGHDAPDGIYFVRLEVDGVTRSKRVARVH